MSSSHRFIDRRDAGRQLAAALRDQAGPGAIVVALPRGGVPIGFEIAAALHAPLEILIVPKLGSPGSVECAIGAIADGLATQPVLNEEALRYVRPPAGYLDAEMERQRQEIARRKSVYLKGRRPLVVRDREAILVDDGIATGCTIRVALRALRQAGASRLLLAVPVAAPSALETLRDEADALVCLHAPPHFRAVGQYYADFDQTQDEEVVRLLRESANN